MSTRIRILYLVLMGLLVAGAGFAGGGQESGDGESAMVAGDGPLTPYDPPITVTVAVRKENWNNWPEGWDETNHPWVEGYERDLGIILDYQFVADQNFGERMDIAIASNQLMDMMRVTPAQLKRLYDSEAIVDLTDIYDGYATSVTEEKMTDDPYGFKMGFIDGKMMALPRISLTAESPAQLWLRTDWMENLGLDEPETQDDVLDIFRAFATQDPDGNGRDDTYGVAIHQNLYNLGEMYVVTAQGFFNSYDAWPMAWIDTGDGRITYGSIEPEMKDALRVLNELYYDGVLDPASMSEATQASARDAITAGQIGAEYGRWWNGGWPLQYSRQQDINANWKAFPVPSADGGVARPLASPSSSQMVAVRDGFEHPEAVVKMLNYYWEKRMASDEDPDVRYEFFSRPIDPDDPEGAQFGFTNLCYVYSYNVLEQSENSAKITEALDTGDTEELNLGQMKTYQDIKRFLDGDEEYLSGYVNYRNIHAREGAYRNVQKWITGEWPMMVDAYPFPPTPQMADLFPDLRDYEFEMMRKIISGEEPIDAFDRFVTEWKRMGGQAILDELNEWYKLNK